MSDKYQFEKNNNIIKEVNSGFYNVTHSRNIIYNIRLNKNKKTKEICKWFKLNDSYDIINSLKIGLNIDNVSFIINRGTEKKYEGTYVHKDLYLIILQWLDFKYSVQIISYLNNLQNKYIEKLNEDLDLSNQLVTTLCNKKDINNICGLYLCDLGSVKDLRDKMNICKIKYPNDNMRIKKFGKSKDIINRFRQHKATYGKINNIRLELFIDLPLCNITDAENKLKVFSKNYLFDYYDGTKKHTELLIVSNTLVLQEYYKLIKNEYPNDVDSVIKNYTNKEKDSKIEILELKNENLEIKNENLELKMKILELSK